MSVVTRGPKKASRHLCAASVLLLVPLSAGCDLDSLALVSADDGGRTDGGFLPDGVVCVPTEDRLEICDGQDNDCDGRIDEDFNLQLDPQNCGECGNSCLQSGALSVCELGSCKNLGCVPGFVDLNQDNSDGCEYACTATGEELCDGVDNDCNGETDETFDLTSDVGNCGSCGNVCRLANAVARCGSGECAVQRCEAGFINKDGDDSNGCEEPCVVSNGGVEACDGQDNDCNGVVDDPGGVPVDFQSDSQNCGACNVVCVLPNAEASCVGGECELSSCKGTFVDADRTDANGCECSPTGSEICDGKDNDCNGAVDDGLPALGSCGQDTGECQRGVLVCRNGVAVCEGAVDPTTETCDGKDNDCTGTADDNLPPSLGACGSNVGECQTGTVVCRNGQPACTGQVGPTAEACDGRDNDCDGNIDNGLTGSQGSCGTDVGECTAGQLLCQNGQLNCVGRVDAQPEVCDGLDNDCSGTPDDNLPMVLGICGSDVGECQVGTILCENGSEVCRGNTGPAAETCDGKDNNCNGTADDNVPGFPGTCGTDTGECQTGTLTCQLGVQVCSGAINPDTEYCDLRDTDCDGSADPATCMFAGTSRENRLDDLGNSTLGANNSVQLSVTGSGSQIVAAWLDRRSGRGDVYVNLSSNGGVSWRSSDIGAATESASKVEPQVVFGGSSRVYLVYGRFASNGRRDVYVRRSSNNGVSWGSATRVDSANRDSLFIRASVVPGSSDRLVICWEEIALSGSTNPNVYCNISRNNGGGFAGVTRVNATSNNALLPRIAIDDNRVYVVWQQGSAIRVARATTGGNSALNFSNEALLSGAGAGRGPEIATNGAGNVVVVWEDLRDPLINIRANRSLDSGASWLSDGVRVDNDVVDGDSTEPMVAMRPGAGGRAYVVWADTSRGEADIYSNVSDDGGSTWGVVASRVTSLTAGQATSARPYLALAPDNNNVYVAWEDDRNGAFRDIQFSLSVDNGITWNIPDYRISESSPPGLADARTPYLWPSSGRVAIIWRDNRTQSGGSLGTGANGDIYASYVQ